MGCHAAGACQWRAGLGGCLVGLVWFGLVLPLPHCPCQMHADLVTLCGAPVVWGWCMASACQWSGGDDPGGVWLQGWEDDEEAPPNRTGQVKAERPRFTQDEFGVPLYSVCVKLAQLNICIYAAYASRPRAPLELAFVSTLTCFDKGATYDGKAQWDQIKAALLERSHRV